MSLGQVAPELLQARELSGIFDPLGEHLQAQGVCDVDDRRQGYPVSGAFLELAGKRAVYLQVVDGETLEIGERRVASAKVVYSQPDALIFELPHHAYR